MRTMFSKRFARYLGLERADRPLASAVTTASPTTCPRLETSGSHHMRKKGRHWVKQPSAVVPTSIALPEPAENDYVFRVSRDSELNSEDTPIHVTGGGSAPAEQPLPGFEENPGETSTTIHCSSDLTNSIYNMTIARQIPLGQVARGNHVYRFTGTRGHYFCALFGPIIGHLPLRFAGSFVASATYGHRPELPALYFCQAQLDNTAAAVNHSDLVLIREVPDYPRDENNDIVSGAMTSVAFTARGVFAPSGQHSCLVFGAPASPPQRNNPDITYGLRFALQIEVQPS